MSETCDRLAFLRITPLDGDSGAMSSDFSIYRVNGYNFVDFERGMLVLDVGCGKGPQLQQLKDVGCRAIGVEPEQELVDDCLARGLSAIQGQAEALPFPDETFDGVICKAVIPFTHPTKALSEIHRVLKPGARAQFVYLGSGAYLRYVIVGPGAWLRNRFYGVRTFLNTWFFALSGRMLPSFMGDTMFQWHGQLNDLYEKIGFTLVSETPSRGFAGLPVLIYHKIQKGSNSVDSQYVDTLRQAEEQPSVR
jgi:ubiquinone/menaquinone biosynthesis C-methylase UbiE